MSSFRNVSDDLLKEWLVFREEDIASLSCKEDKEHFIYFDEISQNIINCVSGSNIEYVQSQLEKLDDNFNSYMDYWFEKYYRNGSIFQKKHYTFKDLVQEYYDYKIDIVEQKTFVNYDYRLKQSMGKIGHVKLQELNVKYLKTSITI